MTWYEIVKYPVRNNYENLWSGSTDIVRKDSGEIIKTIRVKLVEGKDMAESLLENEVKEELNKISIPEDWGKPDQVRLMFHEYDVFNRKIEKYHQMMYVGVERNQVSLEMTNFEEIIIKYLVSFQEKYTKLASNDRLRLIGGSDNEKTDYDLLMEKLNARNFFMKIIVNPSEEVLKAYENMREIIKSTRKAD